jgi:Mrp family chromosome partitioning ATPase
MERITWETLMSRNFELLTQLECELGVAEHRPRKTVDRAVIKDDRAVIKAVASREGGDKRSDEMLRLVRGIFLSPNGSASRQVVFCGVDGDNGSSSVCASAGRTLAANSSGTVCLVDANLRGPRLSKMFGVDTSVPFTGKPASVRDRCVEVGDNLWLAGTAVLGSSGYTFPSADELEERLAQLCSEFDFLLIDAAGVNVSGDAAALGHAADSVVLVVEANTTHRAAARKAKETLDAAGVRLLGTVLHDRSFPIPEGLYRRL